MRGRYRLRKDRVKSSSKPLRFIVDGMHGKLARWLRLMGIDTEYSSLYKDEQLLSKASQEDRILLTSDADLHHKALTRGLDSLLIVLGEESEGLLEVIRHYEIDFQINPEGSLCPKCGSKLKHIPKSEIKDEVPVKSYQLYDEFWTCTNLKCNKIYWRGSHWKNIDKIVEKIRRKLNRGDSEGLAHGRVKG